MCEVPQIELVLADETTSVNKKQNSTLYIMSHFTTEKQNQEKLTIHKDG